MAEALAQPRPARVLVWTWVTLAAGALAAFGAAPFTALALVVGVACVIGVLHSPFIFLWILTAISGVGFGFFDQAALQLGGITVNINGLRWLLVIGACVLILFRAHVRPWRILPGILKPYAWFVALAFAGIIWSTAPVEGVKQALLFLAPLLTALVALHTVQHDYEVRALRAALFIAMIVGGLIAIVPSIVGDALGGSFDQDRPIDRMFGTFLIPILALALARLRTRMDGRHVLVALAVFAVGLLTLSRATILAFLVLGAVLALLGSFRTRVALGALLVMFAAAASSYEPLRERIFSDPRRGFTSTIEVSGRGGKAELIIGGINTSGRGFGWLQTALNGASAPLIGHGTGSATEFMARTTNGEAIYPHNEYLRAWHDWGLIGVAAVLALFAVPIVGLYRRYRAHRNELALAALLCWVGFALIAMFDNALQYFVFFNHNVFLVTVLALHERSAIRPPGSLELSVPVPR